MTEHTRPFADLLGRVVPLLVRRFGPPGAFLVPELAAATDRDTILLPAAEVPEGTVVGAVLQGFVYLDSEDRPIATLTPPPLTLGDVAFLKATDLSDFGAFFDWGLMKELLVPRKEQTREIRVGDEHPIGLFLDSTGRLCGTMRVSELLRDKPDYAAGEWIQGQAWRNEPEIGLFVILGKRSVGLVPKAEPHTLRRGDAAQFRVSQVMPDGKVTLSLRAVAHEQRGSDAEHVLRVLTLRPELSLGDKSTPEEILAATGLSKKAFKRALGQLFKERRVEIQAGVATPSARP